MKRFMDSAIETAKRGIASGQTPFGACVVKGQEVISSCYNTVWLDNDITAHAEINAIRLACQKLNTVDLSGCVIFSTCEPCPMCFVASHWAKISKIVYGAGIEDAAIAGFSELTISNYQMKQQGQSDIEIVSGYMAEQCAELFEIWQQQGNSGTY